MFGAFMILAAAIKVPFVFLPLPLYIHTTEGGMTCNDPKLITSCVCLLIWIHPFNHLAQRPYQVVDLNYLMYKTISLSSNPTINLAIN